MPVLFHFPNFTLPGCGSYNPLLLRNAALSFVILSGYGLVLPFSCLVQVVDGVQPVPVSKNWALAYSSPSKGLVYASAYFLFHSSRLWTSATRASYDKLVFDCAFSGRDCENGIRLGRNAWELYILKPRCGCQVVFVWLYQWTA